MNLMWAALCLLAACVLAVPTAIGGVTVLGAAVVLDSNMLVGSQAGQAPNDVAGLFFLMAALAFLVDGAASAARGRDAAAAPRGTETGGRDGGTRRARDRSGRGRARRGDPRPWRRGRGPAVHGGAGGRPRGRQPRSPMLATIGALTIGVAVLGGRRHGCVPSAVWLGANGDHLRLLYGRKNRLRAQSLPPDRQLGPINLPGPDQLPLDPRPPHSLSEYYNDPNIWKLKLFPVLHDRLGPLWPVILAVVIVALVWALVRGGSALMRIRP